MDFGRADERFISGVTDRTSRAEYDSLLGRFVSVDPKFDGIQTVYGMGYRWQAD